AVASMEHELTAADAAIRTDRPRNGCAFVARLQVARRRAHRFHAVAAAAFGDLCQQRPVHALSSRRAAVDVTREYTRGFRAAPARQFSHARQPALVPGTCQARAWDRSGR